MLARVEKTHYEYVALQGTLGEGELGNGNSLQAIRVLRAAMAAARLSYSFSAPHRFPVNGAGELELLKNEQEFLVNFWRCSCERPPSKGLAGIAQYLLSAGRVGRYTILPPEKGVHSGS